MAYQIHDIPTHNATPAATNEMESAQAGGGTSERSTIAEILDTNATPVGFRYTFKTATSGDPGSGAFLFNNATFASVTQLNISETDGRGAAINLLIKELDNSGECLFIARKRGGGAYFAAWITAPLTDVGAYDTFPITPITSDGSIANNDLCDVEILPMIAGDANLYWDRTGATLTLAGTKTDSLASLASVQVTQTVTNNGAARALLGCRGSTLNGSGSGASGVDGSPNFAPSASVANLRGGTFVPSFQPPTTVTITDAIGGRFGMTYADVAGAVTNGHAVHIASPTISGALKPTNHHGARIQNQGASGITSSYAIRIDAQSGSTNNYGLTSLATKHGFGTETPTVLAEFATGKGLFSGALSLSATVEAAFAVSNTISNSGLGNSGVHVDATFSGAGNLPIGVRAAPTFAPSASIATAGGFVCSASAAPPVGVTITTLSGGSGGIVFNDVAGAVTEGDSFRVSAPIILGALKPTTMVGLSVQNQGAAGITNVYGVRITAQSGGTNNYGLTSLSARHGLGTETPDASSILDLTSTTSGLLTPRMTTTQRDAISSPATGLLVHDTTLDRLMRYDSANWVPAAHGALSVQNTGDTNDSASGSGAYVVHNLNYVLPANFLKVGRAVRVTAHFRVTSGSVPPSLDIQLRAGSTVLAHYTPGAPIASKTNFQMGISWIIQATAAPGGSVNTETVMFGNSNGVTNVATESDTAQPVAIATNATEQLQVATQWSVAGTGTTTIKLSQFIVEML